MIQTMSIPTKQPEEAEEATVAPEERDVGFASLAGVSKSWTSVSFRHQYVKVASEAQIPRKQ
jgi:hypothetical protein